MRGLKQRDGTTSKSRTTHSKWFTHLEWAPFPLGLPLRLDVHIPQNRFLALIKRTRKRVTPGIDQARSLPTAVELAVKDIEEGRGEAKEEERNKDS